jgi:dihydroorotase (multifunctional complex type)
VSEQDTDTSIINVRIVSSAGISEPVDIFIGDGKISGIHRSGVRKPAGNTTDGHGMLALPGFVDLHFHAGMGSINSVYDELKIESRAAVAGGYTYIRSHLIIGAEGKSGYLKIIDPVIKNAEQVTYADLSFNPMIGTEQQALELDELIQKGINAYKIYYNAYQGEEGRKLGIYVDENIDDVVIKALSTAAKYEKTRIIFHAEDNSVVKYFSMKEKNNNGLDAFSRGRPPLAEVIKINHICNLAKEFNARVHIAHISSKEAYDTANRYRQQGVNVTMETEPHYLFHDVSQWDSLGVYGKVNPPLRTPKDREFLIDKLSKRQIDSVSSDVNALNKHQKMRSGERHGSIWDASPGFDNIQMTLPRLVTSFVLKGIMTYETLAYVLSERPASVIGNENKGSISVGKDADIVLIDPSKSHKASIEGLENVPGLDWNPALGTEYSGWPELVFLRGHNVYYDSRVQGKNTGKYVYIK